MIHVYFSLLRVTITVVTPCVLPTALLDTKTVQNV